jgi:hypothetical protein
MISGGKMGVTIKDLARLNKVTEETKPARKSWLDRIMGKK